MEDLSATVLWAKQEYADAELGDRRRTARAVQIAAQAAAGPEPTVSKTFGRTANAEAAFRFVENDAVSVDKLAAAAHRSGTSMRRIVDRNRSDRWDERTRARREGPARLRPVEQPYG